MSRAWPVDDVDPEAPVIDNARRVLAVRIAEFYSFEPVVPHPELSEALHDMRISAKRLRYSLELFRPQFGKPGERQIERVKTIQEILGTLHDHDVRVDLIGDELSQLMLEQSRKTRSDIADASPEELAAIAAANGQFDRKPVNNLSNLDQSVPRCDNHRLHAVPGSELLHRLLDVPFDGPVGNF